MRHRKKIIRGGNCYSSEKKCLLLLSNLSLFYRTQLHDHSVAVVDGFVYAGAGSMEGKVSLLLQDNVQCYNPLLNHWDLMAPLQEARAKAASTDHDGLLYVSGKKRVVVTLSSTIVLYVMGLFWQLFKFCLREMSFIVSCWRRVRKVARLRFTSRNCGPDGPQLLGS